MTIICIGSAGCRESAESWNKKAYKAFIAGERDEAIRCCTKALAQDQDNEWAHYSLGWIYKLDGRTDEAIEEFKKAIVINPNLGGAHNRLGELYFEKGMLDDAIAEFSKVVSNQPDSATADYFLGIAYARKGDLSSAADHLFEAGLLALIYDEKSVAFDAYNSLKKMDNQQLAMELYEVLSPWFDPAPAVVIHSD